MKWLQHLLQFFFYFSRYFSAMEVHSAKSFFFFFIQRKWFWEEWNWKDFLPSCFVWFPRKLELWLMDFSKSLFWRFTDDTPSWHTESRLATTHHVFFPTKVSISIWDCIVCYLQTCTYKMIRPTHIRQKNIYSNPIPICQL